MSLDAAVRKTKTITIGEDINENPVSVTVRGLNASDFAELMNNYEDLMLMLFDGEFDWSSEKAIGNEVMTRAPKLAYLAIALACDEPDKAYAVSQLPMPIQVELFMSVYSLTMPEGAKETSKKLQQLLAPLFVSVKQ